MRILFAIVFAAVALGVAPATASQGRLAVVHFDGPIQGRRRRKRLRVRVTATVGAATFTHALTRKGRH